VNTYKIILRSGQTATVEDNRTLNALATELAHEGFVVVQRRGSYSSSTTEVAYTERAVESIEAIDL
jgi:hypothetical protein